MKIYKFQTNFDYILFFFCVFHSITKYEKIIFLNIFFLGTFYEPNITYKNYFISKASSNSLTYEKNPFIFYLVLGCIGIWNENENMIETKVNNNIM